MKTRDIIKKENDANMLSNIFYQGAYGWDGTISHYETYDNKKYKLLFLIPIAFSVIILFML